MLVLFLLMAVAALSIWLLARWKLGSVHSLGNDILEQAKAEAEALKQKTEVELEVRRQKIRQDRERLQGREDALEKRMHLVERKLTDAEKREAVLKGRREQVKEERQQLRQELERLASLDADGACALLLEQVEKEVAQDAATLIRRSRTEIEETAEREAAKVIGTAINRMAGSVVSEAAVSNVLLPNKEMKGRIIGREGRNIRALEQLTGVNFTIDDTAGAVVLSGFDPIRREIAKTALTQLLLDGRVHPTSIEEAVEKARASVDQQITERGRNAATRAGVSHLHPEIIQLLGKMGFRFSHGQNLLEHSLEVSFLLGMMAAELGLDQQLAKRIGLLHDMGKAVVHEMDGTHAVIGHDLALKYDEHPDVANGIGCHHNEMEPTTLEGSLCGAADTLSAARPGARVEAVDAYVKRLKKLEEIAASFDGVQQAYALQAGREVRVLVEPTLIDDASLTLLAQKLAGKIESSLTYPGKIKVTVMRQNQVVSYAK